MGLYSSWRYAPNQLYSKYKEETWFNEPIGYLTIRYRPIETRMLDTLRYIELDADNANAFSYELGSILRDIGSVFSSVLEKLVRNTLKKPPKRLDISHYLKFLTEEVESIHLLGCELYCPFQKRFVFPFYNIADDKTLPKDRLVWWEPYNNLKHSEVDNLSDGNLANAVYGIASLAILFNSVSPHRYTSKLMGNLGYFKPVDRVYARSFPYAKKRSVRE